MDHGAGTLSDIVVVVLLMHRPGRIDGPAAKTNHGRVAATCVATAAGTAVHESSMQVL